VALDVLGLLAHLIVQVLLDERLDRAGAGASPGLRDRLLALLADDAGRDLTVVRLLLDAALPVGLVGGDGVRAGGAARLVRVRDGDAHARGRPRPRGARGVVGVRDRDRDPGGGLRLRPGGGLRLPGLAAPACHGVDRRHLLASQPVLLPARRLRVARCRSGGPRQPVLRDTEVRVEVVQVVDARLVECAPVADRDVRSWRASRTSRSSSCRSSACVTLRGGYSIFPVFGSLTCGLLVSSVSGRGVPAGSR
jgi:hypothetical protein